MSAFFLEGTLLKHHLRPKIPKIFLLPLLNDENRSWLSPLIIMYNSAIKIRHSSGESQPGRSQVHLCAVFDRINEHGFRVCLGKCPFFQPLVKYLGFIVDKDGRSPDPQNITAVAEMPAPTNITTLRSFLGLVDYYQPFVPNMRSNRQPLDELLKKDNEWIWSARCQHVNKRLRALKAFLIPTSSSLTMTRRLKWSSMQTRQNTDWAPSYNTRGQMAQSWPFLMLRVHWNWQNRTTARLRRRAWHYSAPEINSTSIFTDGISHFSRIIDLFCRYLETARVSQFIQPIAYNAGQQPFLAMT